MSIRFKTQQKASLLRVDTDQYVIKGYASIFGNVDLAGEIVVPGAFEDSLKSKANVPIMWNHNLFSAPIGHTTLLKEDKKGLYYEGLIAPTSQGQDVLALLKRDMLSKASFSYNVLDFYKDDDNIVHLTKLDLIEISPVVWPANEKTSAYIEKIEQEETLEGVFQDEFNRFLNNLELI